MMHYIFADGDFHGNAFVSRHPISLTNNTLVEIGNHDKRNMLQVRLDHPFTTDNQLDFFVTHLDHAVESVRVQQLEYFQSKMWTSAGNVQIVMGDFNSLTMSDYSPNYLRV
jgi:endonuclease/exonuclease/phosphatase family metal-dependent hydrolase